MSKISALPPANDYDGNEMVVMVQRGQTRRGLLTPVIAHLSASYLALATAEADRAEAAALTATLAATGLGVYPSFAALEADATIPADGAVGAFVVTTDGDAHVAVKEPAGARPVATFTTRSSLRNHGINLWEEAKGDGVTLDHDALNDVIETAKNWGVGTINCGGADKVYLIGGVPAKVDANDGNNRYLARLYSNLTFRGNGRGSRPTFRMAGGYERPGELFGDRWWSGVPVENIAFDDIIFDGNMAAQIVPVYAAGTPDNDVAQHQAAIGLLAARGLSVRRCLFKHWRGNGVGMSTNTYVDADDPIFYSGNLLVEDSEFFDIMSIGISFDGYLARSIRNHFHGDGYWVGAISCESLSTRGRIQDVWSESDYFDFRDGLSPVEATLRDHATNSAAAQAARRHFRPAIALSGNYYTENPGNVFGGQFGKVSIVQPRIRQGSILVGGFERVLIDAPDIENSYEDIARLWPPRPHAITIQPAAGGGNVTGLSQASVRNARIRHDMDHHGILVTAYDEVEISGGSITGPRTAAIRLENCGGSVTDIVLKDYGRKTTRADWLPLYDNTTNGDGSPWTQAQKDEAADALVGSTGAGVCLFGARDDLTVADIRARDTRTGAAVQSEYAVYANVDDSQIVRIRDIGARGMLGVKDVNDTALVSGVMENTFRQWKTNALVEIGGGLRAYGNPEFINASGNLTVNLRAPQGNSRTLSFVDQDDHIEAQIVHTADGTTQVMVFDDGNFVAVPIAWKLDGTTRLGWGWERPVALIAADGSHIAWRWADAQGRERSSPTRPVSDQDGTIIGNQADTGDGGLLIAGLWSGFTGLPRLRLNGTGTVTIDARNGDGAVFPGIETYTIDAASNQIEWPYFGDDAVQIRAAYTGTATAEII